MSPPQAKEIRQTVIIEVEGEKIRVPVIMTGSRTLLVYLEIAPYGVIPVYCSDLATLRCVILSVGKEAIHDPPARGY